MLLIQYFPRINAAFKALIYAVARAFIYQPLMEWAGLYMNDEWKDWYSFPILFALFLVARWLATRKQFEPVV